MRTFRSCSAMIDEGKSDSIPVSGESGARKATNRDHEDGRDQIITRLSGRSSCDWRDEDTGAWAVMIIASNFLTDFSVQDRSRIQCSKQSQLLVRHSCIPGTLSELETPSSCRLVSFHCSWSRFAETVFGTVVGWAQGYRVRRRRQDFNSPPRKVSRSPS